MILLPAVPVNVMVAFWPAVVEALTPGAVEVDRAEVEVSGDRPGLDRDRTSRGAGQGRP